MLNIKTLKNDYYIVRHGQSLANVSKLIASNPEIATKQYGLSDIGKNQVETIAIPSVIQYYTSSCDDNDNNDNKKKKYDGLVIVTSDLLRAKETATILRNGIIDYNNNNNDNNVNEIPIYTNDIIIDIRLRERWFGNYDLTSDDNYQRVWDDDAIDSSHTNNNVESVDSVMARVTSTLLEWDDTLSSASESESSNNDSSDNNKTSNKKYMVVFVAHGDVLQILQTACLNQPGSKHRTAVEHLQTATVRPIT